MINQVWVSPNGEDGWKVHSPGAKRDSAHADTKAQAIDRAREIAQNKGAELKIQNKDSKISNSNSYGKDPFPPRG